MATQLFYREVYQRTLHVDQMLPQQRPKTLPVVLGQVLAKEVDFTIASTTRESSA